ncbi:MAG: GNAT family N-acetyltransferase [Candidatus Yonathbacteria bacterium]|nr:GNAT family N-acetyltransferase [Candidatus Yonathbacteria bacterium]
MFRIRTATLEDLRYIMQFEGKLFDMHYAFDTYYGLYEDYVNLEEFLLAQMERCGNDRLYLVAENEAGEIIGFASASAIIIPDSDAPRVGRLLSIFVLEEYRRRGIGKALREGRIAWLSMCQVDYIETGINPHNTSMLAHIKKDGFTEYMIIFKKKISNR